MSERKRIVVLGSTGSIGRQTLDVVAQHPDKLEVVALAAHGSVDGLLAQARAFGVRHVALGDPAADPLKLRRLGFYARNGAVTLGYDCALFGVHYKTICWADPLPDEDEILRKHQEIYLEQFGPERYGQYIQIPLRPGESPRPLTDWAEDID